MTDWASAPQDFAAFVPLRRSSKPVPLSVFCVMALLASASFGLSILRTEKPTAGAGISATRVMPSVPLSTLYGALLETRTARPYGSLAESPIAPRDPAFARTAPLGVDLAWRHRSVTEDLTQVATANPQAGDPSAIPRPADADLAQGIPMPPPRPLLRAAETGQKASLASIGQPAASSQAVISAPAQPSFFEKLFGRHDGATALAYAPGDGGLGGLLTGHITTADHETTAIYDISAHTVILPDGTRLEAHSGLGASHDDPNSVAQRMHGATPPNIYALDFREAPFHGVRALRLTPVGNGETYGRGGLLAHTYMLGPRGDSNGCVVFKDYQAFLQAFETGHVKRLMVVSRL